MPSAPGACHLTNLIINIAGTNGSGKSTVVTRLLKLYEKGRVTQTLDGKVIGYHFVHPAPHANGPGTLVRVVGGYERPTGGCDTIKTPDEALLVVRGLAEDNDCHVIYEGAFVMHQITGPALARAFPGRYVVLLLTTPLAACVKAINQRRAERGETPINSVANVETNWRRSHHYATKMQGAGAKVLRVSRENALPQLLELLATA